MSEFLLGASPLSAADLLQVFVHFALLSLLAVGGAITTVPDMHRLVVDRRGWLDDAQFNGSIALAQAAPGPNVLFVAVIGFNVAGLAGVAATLGGSLVPSVVLAFTFARWLEPRRETPGVRAFTQGLAPLTIGLLLSTGWVLVEPARGRWTMWLLLAATVVFMLRTRRSPLWPIAAGAVAGALGWV
ncbi:MAG: chromate transporter [Rubrivivax sp.]|jgi:chromate transporter